MIDYSTQTRHDILCVDMKSFFATCECVERGFDPMKKKLAVVGKENKDGSVVLAASPELKKVGIKTGSRLYEIKRLNDPSIFIAQARMSLYQRQSEKIRDIFEQFVPPHQIDVYSIDEAWLTLDGTRSLWGSPWQTADKIRKEIKSQTGIIATVGIGDNKLLAKVVLDNYAKNEGIAECRYEDVATLLHPLAVDQMWGIGNQMKKHFETMRVYTIGDLANASPDIIRKNLGVIGLKLQRYACGLDDSPVFYKDKQFTPSFSNTDENAKSIGRGVTLWEDYRDASDVYLVISELIAEICEVMRSRKKIGKTIQLTIEYSRKEVDKGFSRQRTLLSETNDNSALRTCAIEIFKEYYIEQKPVRKIRVSVGNLMEETELRESKNQRLMDVQDEINHKFGKGTIQRASSMQKKSITKEQNKKIRGHYE